MPPPEVVMILLPLNEKTAAQASAPAWRPPARAPTASAESQITGTPWRSQSARMRGKSHGWPYRSVGITALGRRPRRAASASACSSSAGSMFQVAASQSMNVSVAPSKVAGVTLPMNVSVAARISSPGLTSRCRSARCVAAVPLASARQCGMPTYAANSRSNASTIGPSGAM